MWLPSSLYLAMLSQYFSWMPVRFSCRFNWSLKCFFWAPLLRLPSRLRLSSGLRLPLPSDGLGQCDIVSCPRVQLLQGFDTRTSCMSVKGHIHTTMKVVDAQTHLVLQVDIASRVQEVLDDVVVLPPYSMVERRDAMLVDGVEKSTSYHQDLYNVQVAPGCSTQ